jgi:Flp pilus assembly protein TadB
MKNGVSTWAAVWVLVCVVAATWAAIAGSEVWLGRIIVGCLAGALILRLLQSRLRSRPCPRCGERVPNSVLLCSRCGFDFAQVGT